jgi:hypothetical protein
MENNKKSSSTAVTAVVIVAIIAVLAYVLIYKPRVAQPGDTTHTPVTVTPTISGDTADFVSFSILPGSSVSGIVNATGSVKGSYFFEANMVVKILDADKNELKSGHGTATSDWMTEGPVVFGTTLDFTGITQGSGFIRLQNDNPSGDPARDKYIDIPVVFHG